MDEDEDLRWEPRTHEVGMVLDAMSVEELNERIGMLREEIARLEAAIAVRAQTRSEAESLFRL